MKRNHTCGELTAKNIGQETALCGWVSSRRDHGGVIFIDLRDRYGFTQIVFNPENDETMKEANKLRREDVIKITGTVRSRPKGMENPKMVTGEIEVLVNDLEILNKAETPPIEVEDRIVANEDLRLKYRYLDLRRPIMQKQLILRHNVTQAAREFLNSNNFLEIETPMLIRSTPEGARDYIVPSRINPGTAYSLPQSPQLYKQILMVSGMDRYYQIARCLRDEDLRADRQPEFTQIDIEMSFVDEDDIYHIGDGLMKHIFKKTLNIDLKTPFPRIPYTEAIERFGTDKPDLRYGMELVNVTEIVKNSDFSVFKVAIEEGGQVKCINAKGCAKFTRKDIEELTEFVKQYKAKGLAWAKIIEGKMESSIVKYFSEDIQNQIKKLTEARNDDLLLFVADNPKIVTESLGNLRKEIAKRLNLLDAKDFKFCWVMDFPLFEWNEEENRWDAAHHIFTMPKAEHLEYLDTDPGKVKATCYDLVLNGIELASGSIRIHRQDIQERVMKVIGLTHEDAMKKFGFLLEAFKYGAPPHGGFAPGLDRLVALMCGFNDIREVMAFPKNKNAECPMDGCPTKVEEKTLRELKIKFDVKK